MVSRLPAMQNIYLTTYQKQKLNFLRKKLGILQKNIDYLRH